MELAIKDITELRKEIDNLKGVERDQAAVLKHRFSSPALIFSTVLSLFSKEPGEGSHKQPARLFNKDLVSMISRVVLPFTLNKTIFRRSNFIVKFLVNLASQRASKLITEKSVVSVWDRIKALIPVKSKPPVHKAAKPVLLITESTPSSPVNTVRLLPDDIG